MLRESAIRDLAAADRKALSDDVVERVEAAVQGALAAARPDRRRALEDLARRATSRALPAEIVDRWLGFRERRGPKKEDAAPRRTDAAGIATLLAAQVGVAAGPGDLRLLPKETAVLEEIGSAGAGNGLVDAGEWVRLQLTLQNTSPRPWFSSSVAGRSDAACLWVDPSGAELAELEAVEGRGQVALWVYVGRDCGGGARRLHLAVRDTHRSPVQEVELTAVLAPLDVPAPRPLAGRFDADDLGSSDGSQRKEVGPGLRFEYSLDLAVAGTEPAAVRMTYSVPADLERAFSSFTYRDVVLGRDADRVYRAADDFDATVVGRKDYQAVLQQARASRRWVTGRTPARLWLAIDAVVEVQPGAAGAPASSPPAKAACPAPLPEEQVVDIVKRHLSLSPHPINPALPSAVAAAAGYEVTFDARKFGEDYRAAAWPQAAPAKEAVVEPLRYRYRLYQALPMLAVGLPEAPPVEPKPAPPPPREAMFRLDLGGAWTGYQAKDGVDTGQFGSRSLVDVGSGTARLMFGLETVGLVRLAYGSDGQTTDSTGRTHFEETSVAAGIGYLWRPGTVVEVVPRAALAVHFRTLADAGSATTIGLEVGVTVRARSEGPIGVYADVDGIVGPAGPADLVSGQGFRLGGGLSFVF